MKLTSGSCLTFAKSVLKCCWDTLYAPWGLGFHSTVLSSSPSSIRSEDGIGTDGMSQQGCHVDGSTLPQPACSRQNDALACLLTTLGYVILAKSKSFFSKLEISMSFYKIQSGPLVFYAKIDDRPLEKRKVIYFGSAQFKDCLSIHVFNRSNFAELHGVIYNRLCAINMPLPKRDGTVRMIKAAMTFALEQFPHIQRFVLTDISHIECGKYKVSLSDMYFVTRAQTWYESKFGAEPLFKEYDLLKQEFASKPVLEFKDLWDQYLQDGEMLYKNDKDYYESMYNESESWFSFLQQWMSEEGCRPFVWLSDTPIGIIAVVSQVIQTLHGKDWKISKETVQSYNPIYIERVGLESFPDIEWRDDVTPKKGGAMLFPEEVLYD